MEALIQILETVKDISGPALWVGGGAVFMLFVYKTIIIGSLYAVIKFGIEKASEVLLKPKHELVIEEVRTTLDGETIGDALDSLMSQIRRIKNKGQDTGSTYIHSSDVDWLRKAIDEKIERDDPPN